MAQTQPLIDVNAMQPMPQKTNLKQQPFALFLWVALGTAACQDPPRPQVFTPDETSPPAAEPLATATTPSPDTLTEGEIVVAGLTLPGTAHELPEEKTERTRVFVIPASIDATSRFFAARLLTGRIDTLGTGRVYRDASPRGAAAHLDVAILPSTQGTRIAITELPAPTKTPPSEDELRRRLQAHAREAIE